MTGYGPMFSRPLQKRVGVALCLHGSLAAELIYSMFLATGLPKDLSSESLLPMEARWDRVTEEAGAGWAGERASH